MDGFRYFPFSYRSTNPKVVSTALGARALLFKNRANRLSAHGGVSYRRPPPPIPQTTSYFIAVNGQQQGPYDANALMSYIAQGQIQRNTLVWKNGMPNWAPISTLPEFANAFGAVPPPLPPQP